MPDLIFPPSSNSGSRSIIERQRLSQNQTTITFSSIPVTYNNLYINARLRANAGASDVEEVRMTINGDTTNSNYVYGLHFGGSSAGSAGSNERICATITGSSAPATAVGMFQIFLADVQSSYLGKAFITNNWVHRSATVFVLQYAGQRLNAEPITSLAFSLVSGNQFQSSGVMELWGEL